MFEGLKGGSELIKADFLSDSCTSVYCFFFSILDPHDGFIAVLLHTTFFNCIVHL